MNTVDPNALTASGEWQTRGFPAALSSQSTPRSRKLQAKHYQPSGRYPVIDQSQRDIAGWTDDRSLVIDIDLPYIVFGDHTRAFKFVDRPFALGADGTQLLKPSEEYVARFFYYACLNLDLPNRGYNRHFTLLKGTTLPLPPRREQEHIATILWTLQRAVAVQDRLIAATRELKQAAMQRLFTRGLRGEPLHQTPIGEMPESWSPKAVLELCEIWSGGTPRKSVAEYWYGDIPWASGKDLKTPSLDDVIDHVSPEGVDAGSRLAPAGSVFLLVRGMGLAKDLPVAVINRPMAFNQDIKALVTRGVYSGAFIRSGIYAGKDRLLAKIVPSAHGTMTLNLDDIEKFQIACPADREEAEQIAVALSTLDGKLAHHQRKRVALNDFFHAALHKLMTAQIRVIDLDIDTSEVVDSAEAGAQE